jgi:tetratricopeptide (TPR) repeat protein
MTSAGKHIARLASVAPLLGLLGFAGFASIRNYTVANLVENANEANLRKAVSLAPSNSFAWAQLGAILERRGETDAALQPLERAVELNPYDYGAWLDLGLHWETEGDAAKAEKCLQEAIRTSGGYYPRWVLANFYLRQADTTRFWSAMQAAILSGQADLRPAFQLYWRAFDDAGVILENGVPDRPDINRKYCEFLLASNRAGAVKPVWQRVSLDLQPRDREMGLRYAEALLANRQVGDAVHVWNQLCAAHILTYDALDAVRGPFLTNGRFEQAPSGRLFDWKLLPSEGVVARVISADGRKQLQIRFAGAHQESAELAAQSIPVSPAKTYQLKYRYSTADLPDATGLYWSAEDAGTGEKLMRPAPLPAAEKGWREGEAVVRTGSQTRLIHLSFGYRRAEGTVRTEGSVALAAVELTLSGSASHPGHEEKEEQ